MVAAQYCGAYNKKNTLNQLVEWFLGLLILQCSIAILTCLESSISKVLNSKYRHLLVPGFFGSYHHNPLRVTRDRRASLVIAIAEPISFASNRK